ncbi:uncharacterized protein LOC135471860 [Liolophura sinensis]|uniref:uncharacterized protein LOC135471860 n=1 Tax=Liolophura sinensis TaxID=3198878 RepID=UPI003158EC55
MSWPRMGSCSSFACFPQKLSSFSFHDICVIEKESKMPHHCCVPLCSSDTRLESCKHLSFHSFPSDKDLVKKWIVNMRRDIGKDFAINRHTCVCSLHFTEDCYPKHQGIRRRLVKDAIPTVFHWCKGTSTQHSRRKIKKQISSVASENKENKAATGLQQFSVEEHSYSRQYTDGAMYTIYPTTLRRYLESSSSGDDSLEDYEPSVSPDKASVLQTNLNLMTLRYEEKFTLLRFCNSDSDIKYYTGFQSYISLSCFFQFLQPECNFLYYVGTENTSSGTPYDLLKKRGPSRSLSPMEELFITLVRLRKGLQERLIGDLYSISEGHVSKIVNTWIIFLADRFRSLPIWPKAKQVRKTMPACFREHYSTTRAIVDCTELFIEQPSASDCQRETFSSYKHHNTAKGLIAISPVGQLTFISPLYAGRCSDKKIIRHCGLLDLLEDGDSLMVDRGFDIREDVERRGASLIIPTFLHGQQQFTDEQLKFSRGVAAVRVHVEQAVRKVKEFEIIRNIVPISLCPMIEKVWLVCGHLSNFTGTLFKG